MPTPELKVDQNPEFIADMHNEAMFNSDISSKWHVSNGYVGDRRARIRKGLPMTEETAKDGETTEVTTREDGLKEFSFIRHRPVTLEDARKLIRSTGDNPDHYNISIKSIAYGGDKSSNKISAWPKSGMALVETFSLDHLYAEAKKVKRAASGFSPDSGRSTVVVISDWQIGKTGRRGGTPELLERLEDARNKVAIELAKRDPASILILDGGDGIEGFESGGDPAFTNDLSLPDQIDCYATELFKFVRLANTFASETHVAVAPSNHSSWRRGKQNLGKPSDDFGVHAHKQVSKVAAAAGMEITWHYADDYDESLCVDFAGSAIGLVHGNQFAPGKAIDWWQAQTFGDQACARADVLVTAHYHSFGAGVAGMNPFSKRERMWLGAPTLDSGSDWYRNIKGRDSLPGTMIFDITADGFDLSSLTIV